MPDHLVGGAGAVGHEKAVIGIENARCVALARPNGAIVVEQLTELFDRIADVGAQHVFAKELVKHLPHRALEKGHATRMPRAVPGIRPVFGIVEQSLEERRLQPFEVAFGLANDVPGHKFGGVLEHVNEAVQLAQDVVGNMPRGLGLAVDINRHIQVFAAHLLNEAAQAQHRRIQVGPRRELFVVN